MPKAVHNATIALLTLTSTEGTLCEKERIALKRSGINANVRRQTPQMDANFAYFFRCWLIKFFHFFF
jgi:hypothetical protein